MKAQGFAVAQSYPVAVIPFLLPPLRGARARQQITALIAWQDHDGGTAMRVHDMTLPAAAVAALQRALDELRSQPAYVYPWAGLTGGVRLVGYGSLLNAASAARTLAPGGARRPVLAFGARRLFDCEMSAGALQRYGAGADSRGGAALNVRITSVIGDAVNGILFDIPAAEIEALRVRETGYDLAPVICSPWEQFDETPFVAHILTRL